MILKLHPTRTATRKGCLGALYRGKDYIGITSQVHRLPKEKNTPITIDNTKVLVNTKETMKSLKATYSIDYGGRFWKLIHTWTALAMKVS